MKQLILGGARSGKSSLAEQLASRSDKTVHYIATANSRLNDKEMAQRIDHHRQQRPAHWQTIEEPIQLAAQLQQLDSPNNCLLVDCLTLWLSNCLFNESVECWPQQRQALVDALLSSQAEVILVGNEVGSGIVPMGEANRQFVDENGFLHQTLASHCERVVFVAAGLPLVMKGPSL
jgi:adenosylcobinamide kinase/adenosylcobinamide-phosphate guanylyltransferase